MEKIMPDLFVVMSNDEFREAIEYARQEGASKATCLMAMNYDLIINGHIAETDVQTKDGWFPKFTEYISLPTEDDEIGVLLSPTVWNEYDERIIYDTMQKNKISLNIMYDPLFIQPKKMMDYIEEEKKFSQENPINSPWTARDMDVVGAGLTAIKNIKKATILSQANFEIAIYVRDIEEKCDEFVLAEDIASKKIIQRYKYPSVAHLETDNGDFNIYMGESINPMEVLARLEHMGIDSIIKEYEDKDQALLLYEARSKDNKLVKDSE